METDDELQVRGRDRAHAGPARRVQVGMRFTGEDFVAVRRAAAQAGLTPAGYCAEAALAAARQDPPPRRRQVLPKAEREAVQELAVALMASRTALNRVGANLNQAVAELHATGREPASLRDVAEVVAGRVRAVDQMMNQLRGWAGVE